MTNSNFTPQSRKSNLVVQDLEAEVLIYDLNSNKAFNLNHTAASVWQLSDGKKTVAEISKSLSKKFDSNVSEDLVWLAIDQFKRDNLLEDSFAVATPFEGLSRRDVIKKVGLASLVALPIVASLAAPNSASAASLRPNGAACTTATQCASSCCSGTTCQPNRTLATGAACTNSCQCITFCTAQGICA